MKITQNTPAKLILALVKLVVGILLLVNPEAFTVTVITALGILLMVDGAINLLMWLKQRKTGDESTGTIVKACILLIVGLLVAVLARRIVGLFPVLAVIYGILAIITGLVQLVWTIDLARMKSAAWIWQAVSAVVAIVLGIIVIANPFATTKALWTFTGIAIIVAVIPDIIVLLTAGKKAEKK